MTTAEQRGAAYARLNGQRMVPCLELPDGRVIPQSLAIIDYLEALFPNPPIYPADQVERAQALGLALFITCETAPLQAKLVRRTLAEDFGFTEQRDEQWVRHWIRRGLGLIEDFLGNREQQAPFALGDAPGIVDVCVIPQLRNAHRLGVPCDDFLHLRRLETACLEHPAFAAAHPDRWQA
jgi:maleylacetoacetate isomerase